MSKSTEVSASSLPVLDQSFDGPGDPDPYSADWTAELVSLSEQLERNASAIVDEFYGDLARLPKCKATLDALSPEELEHLKSKQMRNLLALADPALTEDVHRSTALNVGRIHAQVGLDREELVRSRGILASAIDNVLRRSASREAVHVYSQRLNRDLAFQVQAYQELHENRRVGLSRLAHGAWSADSYADLIDHIVEVLGDCEEIAGCAISRPDEHGVFRIESAAGRILDGRTDDIAPGTPRELPLLAAAWHSTNIERCINIATDPAMTAWRAAAMRKQIRSCAAIPLRLSKGAPFAVLMLYSAFPGGYSSADQTAFLDLVQTLLALAINRLANQDGAVSAISHSTRGRWKALLRSESLRMYCQPIVELKTGRLIKVEMLARLDDGARLLAPHEFFPALGSEDFLELYVRGLNDALSRRGEWLSTGMNIGVSLNLPSSALLDIRYFEATRQALAVHHYPPHMLTLELLEAEAVPLDAHVQSELARFKSLGIMLAEDDLGAGHSSLSRLREMPFDWIKIDRSIVSLAGHNASTVLSFVYQLTRLGHALGKSVIVEGVENDALLEACRILNVDAVQGYVIARPMPLEQLPEWVRNRPAWPETTESPRHAMGRLAHLLIWEERLHLAQADLSVIERLLDGTSATLTPAATDDTTSPQSPQDCVSCSLAAFFTGFEAAFENEEGMLQELIHAAVVHGRRSSEYQGARERLVSTLGMDAPTV